MSPSERVISKLLEPAGVSLNGERPWDIQVHDQRLFPRVLRQGNLGLGEAYMEGWWDCGRIDEMIARVLKAHLDRKAGRVRLLLSAIPALLLNPQTVRGSRKVARKHYDLGNDLFLSFLDANNQYSCAYFNGCDDLDRAQERKLEMICDKLDLAPGDRLLDIGCGWGGLARYAAEKRGCEVTAGTSPGNRRNTPAAPAPGCP